MKTMRQGFTMVELIFVIVIIGILASVAIPKLAATRDDAQISKIIANAKTVLADFQSYYTSQGNTIWASTDTKITDVTNAHVTGRAGCGTLDGTSPVTGSWWTICEEATATANPCVYIVPSAASVGWGAAAEALIVTFPNGSELCSAVAKDPAILAIAGKPGIGKIHTLGSQTVVR